MASNGGWAEPAVMPSDRGSFKIIMLYKPLFMKSNKVEEEVLKVAPDLPDLSMSCPVESDPASINPCPSLCENQLIEFHCQGAW